LTLAVHFDLANEQSGPEYRKLPRISHDLKKTKKMLESEFPDDEAIYFLRKLTLNYLLWKAKVSLSSNPRDR